MSKIDIKAMIKDLKKNELTELISVAQEVLSTLFNSSEIRDNVKESRFSKGYECPKCQCKDVNKNGIVDTGNLLEHRQPKKVRFYKLEDGTFLIDIPEMMEIEQKIDVGEIFR